MVLRKLTGPDPVNCATIVAALEIIIENPAHKPTTIGRRVIAIQGFLRWWDQSVVTEVFSQIKFRMKKPKRLPRIIPRNELSLLLDGAQNTPQNQVAEEMRLILLLFASTGLRVSELCSLRLMDVDSGTGELKVFGKGAKERVVVIANAEVREALAKYIREKRFQEPLKSPLFLNKRRKSIAPKWVRLRLKRIAELSGVRRKITPHMFRHTAATLLIEGGVDIRFVQRLLGHANLATTEIYTHVSGQALRSALERADVMRGIV